VVIQSVPRRRPSVIAAVATPLTAAHTVERQPAVQRVLDGKESPGREPRRPVTFDSAI
jgi:hypothetical protein